MIGEERVREIFEEIMAENFTCRGIGIGILLISFQ
jgi:hypothetical protein